MSDPEVDCEEDEDEDDDEDMEEEEEKEEEGEEKSGGLSGGAGRVTDCAWLLEAEAAEAMEGVVATTRASQREVMISRKAVSSAGETV